MTVPVDLAALEEDVVRVRLACDVAYEKDPGAVAGKLDAMGLELVRFYGDQATGADAFLARAARRAYFVPRGTEKDFADIVTDMDFAWVDYEPSQRPRTGARVHRGFDRAFNAIRKEVDADVADLLDDGVDTEGVGHSLGGAIAVHAGAAGIVRHVTSFGAPRVGDKAFAAHCQRLFDHRRFVRGADIVPLVPLLAMGARHDCAALYFDSGGELHPEASIAREIVGRAFSLFTVEWSKGWTPAPVPTRTFTDHRGQGYIEDVVAWRDWLRAMASSRDVLGHAA